MPHVVLMVRASFRQSMLNYHGLYTAYVYPVFGYDLGDYLRFQSDFIIGKKCSFEWFLPLHCPRGP